MECRGVLGAASTDGDVELWLVQMPDETTLGERTSFDGSTLRLKAGCDGAVLPPVNGPSLGALQLKHAHQAQALDSHKGFSNAAQRSFIVLSERLPAGKLWAVLPSCQAGHDDEEDDDNQCVVLPIQRSLTVVTTPSVSTSDSSWDLNSYSHLSEKGPGGVPSPSATLHISGALEAGTPSLVSSGKERKRVKPSRNVAHLGNGVRAGSSASQVLENRLPADAHADERLKKGSKKERGINRTPPVEIPLGTGSPPAELLPSEGRKLPSEGGKLPTAAGDGEESLKKRKKGEVTSKQVHISSGSAQSKAQVKVLSSGPVQSGGQVNCIADKIQKKRKAKTKS